MALLIATILPPLTVAFNLNEAISLGEDTNLTIFEDIEMTEDKSLVIDRVIGDVHVKYWEHIVNGVYVKNDSILLHLDIEFEDVIKYQKSWADIERTLSNHEEITFEPENYVQKQLVAFPDEEDCTFYYTFYNLQEYPLICWEVTYADGSIIFYDLPGKEIGYSIQMPSNGFSMSGHNHLPGGNEDPWKGWRENADSYFQEWCGSADSISLPLASTVTSYVSDPSVEIFYEIAHGDYERFRCARYPAKEIYYHSTGSWFYCAQNDMAGRSPMWFAFIGSCGGMDETGPGSFSDEFRKGQMKNTVTIGYTDMSTPAWYKSFVWQDFMFTKMDEGEKIYDAFLAACAEYPILYEPDDPKVAFVGDENITIFTRSRSDIINLNLLQILEKFPLLIRLLSLGGLIS